MDLYEKVDFKRCLRADRNTFCFLVTNLSPVLAKEETRFGNTIQIDKRIAVGLWHYPQGGTIFTTGDKFAISTSAAHGIVYAFIDAVISVFSDRIALPVGDALQQVIKDFESRRGLPNCFGAINCSHILTYTPAIEVTKGYVDRSDKMRVILQANVDSLGRFLSVTAGWPGSVNDKRVFAVSAIYSALKSRSIMQEPVVVINGKNVLPCLVGDAGYTLDTFCIIPYSGKLLPHIMDRFNLYQSSTRLSSSFHCYKWDQSCVPLPRTAGLHKNSQRVEMATKPLLT